MLGIRTVKLVAVVVSALCLGVTGLVMNSAEFWIMALALAAFAAIPYAMSRVAMGRIQIERRSPGYVREEEEMRVRIEVRGRLGLLGRVTATDWIAERLCTEHGQGCLGEVSYGEPVDRILDWLYPWLGLGRRDGNDDEELPDSTGDQSASEDGEEELERPSLWDRLLRRLGYVDDSRGPNGGEEESDWIIETFRLETATREVERSDEKVVCEYVLTPLRRGTYELGPVSMLFTDPLGLFEFPRTLPTESRLTVVPNPLRVEGLSIWSTGSLGEHQFEGVGAKGSGIEFHGIREYKPGDELRRVHWRSTARHGQLNVIEFEHSRAEDTIIAVDLKRGTVRGRGRFSTLEYAVRIAADVADQAVSIGSLVRLACAGLVGPAASPARGRDQLYTILDALAGAEADQEQPLSEVLSSRMDTIVHGADVICITSAVDEGLEQCAQYLRPAGVTLQLILVTVKGQRQTEDTSRLERLAASGVRVTVVEGSARRVACHVVRRYEC